MITADCKTRTYIIDFMFCEFLDNLIRQLRELEGQTVCTRLDYEQQRMKEVFWKIRPIYMFIYNRHCKKYSGEA